MAKIDFTKVLVDLDGKPFKEAVRDFDGHLLDESGKKVEYVEAENGKRQLKEGTKLKKVDITLAKLAVDALGTPDAKIDGNAMIDQTIIALEIKKNEKEVDLISEQIIRVKSVIEKYTNHPVIYYRACEILDDKTPAPKQKRSTP